MTVLWFLQRPEHSLGKPIVFVWLACCYVVVNEFFLSARLIFVPSLSLFYASPTLKGFSLGCYASVMPCLCCGFAFWANRHQAGTGFL